MGLEHGSGLLVEGRCTQNRLELVPAPPRVQSDGSAPSQAMAGRPRVCYSRDHVALSRRCSVWASSTARACLLANNPG